MSRLSDDMKHDLSSTPLPWHLSDFRSMCRRSKFVQSGWHLSMYACRVGGSKWPSFKDERWASVLPCTVESPPSLSLHQHNGPAKPWTQEALRASDTNWSSSISLFLFFPYRALFVQFKAFPPCFFPAPQRERGAGASETIALLSHWRPLLSPLLPTALAVSLRAGGFLQCRADWMLVDFSRALKAKFHLLSSLGGAFKWPLGYRVTTRRVPVYRHYAGVCRRVCLRWR